MSSMKISKVKTLTLMALLCASMLSSYAYMASGETEQLFVDIDRSVKIVRGGIVFLNDTFTLSAPEGSEAIVTDFWMGFSDTLTPERSIFEVWEFDSWRQVDASGLDIQGIQGSRIEFTVPITLRAGTSLTLRASYLSLDSVSGTSTAYAAILPVFPVIDYNISRYQLEVELPPGAIFDQVISPINMTQIEVGDHWNVIYLGENIVADSGVYASILYTHSTDDELLLVVDDVSRSITVKSSILVVEDSYSLTNKGPILFGFPLELPPDASNIKARDGVGTLETIATESDESKEVAVFPRSPIMPGDRWVFSVTYTTENGEHVSTAGGSSHLSYPNIELPHFIRGLEATVSRVESDVVRLTYGATLQSERPAIEAEIPSGSIMPSLRPIAIVAAFGLVVAAIVFLRRRKKPARVELTLEAEVPTLKEFIEKQRERIGHLKALESLEEELEEGKIEKDQYERLAAEHSRGVSKLADSLKQLERELADEPELSEPLKEIKQAEGEFTRIASDLRNLEVRLRTRRVSRRDYERRKRDRIRRRGLAIKKIEKAIESLGG
ncbi:hypothetical protein H8E65_04155 [Candidatus Bathyarchaeota archaeon]|nr:hypothetical protein [Candidatus Bathyarchaeota archaeon]